MIPWILTFEFDLIVGSFLFFLGPNGLVRGVRVGFDNFYFLCFLQFWHSILIWFSGRFWLFCALMGYFWVQCRVQKLFLGLLRWMKNFHFLWFLKFWHLIWLDFGVLMGYFWGQVWVQKIFLRLDQLLFSLFSLILTFDFELFWCKFWLSGALMGYFLCHSLV